MVKRAVAAKLLFNLVVNTTCVAAS